MAKASAIGALFGVLYQSPWSNSGWGNTSPWSNAQTRTAWRDSGSNINTAVPPTPAPSAPPAAPATVISPPSGGTYTDSQGQPISREQAMISGSIDAPGDAAAKAAQIGLTPDMALRQGAGSETLKELTQAPSPEITQARVEAIAKGVQLSPDIQAQIKPPVYTPSQDFSEKMAGFLAGGTAGAPIQFVSEEAKLRAIEIASKSSQGSPTFYSYATPEEIARADALKSFMAYTGLSYKPGKFTSEAPIQSSPAISGMMGNVSPEAMSRNLTLSPDVMAGMAKARQDIQDQKTASEFAKYSTIEKAVVVLGMDPGAIIDLYASKSTVLGKPLAGQDILTIPKGWVGGETDWKWRIPTQAESEKAYLKTKAETIQEGKDMQSSKDISMLGIVPLTGQSAKIYRSVQYGATWLPTQAVVTYGAGALLGTAIPLTGALSRIGLSKVASKLATTETSGIGAKATEFAVKKIAKPIAENAESLMNVAGAGMILGQVKKAGQTDQGLTLGTSVVEGAKLAVAYKGFQKTYEPTMKALKGVESLPKGIKTISAVEKEMAGLKSEKGTFGWTGEAPRSPTSNAPSGQRLLELDKEIAGQSRWTGGVGGKSGEAPSNYPKPPGRFGFSDLMGKLPESFGKYSESGSIKSLRANEYGYGQEVIPNPFEGFGGVSKTIIGMGKGLAERGELPVPDFGSGLLKSYMGTELQIKDMNVFRPEVNPKIDMFGNLRGEGKNEVIVSHPVWTGSELGYDVFNQQKYGYREPIKNREVYPTPVEFPGRNPIEYPNPVKNPVVNPNPNINENPNKYQYVYENKYDRTPPPPDKPGAGIFLPPKLGAGGFTGFGYERIGKSVIEHKLTDPTSLFTGGRTFASSTSVPYQSNMMTLNIKAKQATPTNASKIAKSMFELNIQQEKQAPKAQKIHVPKISKSSVPKMTQNFLSLDIPMKKGAKRRKNK